MQQQPPTEQQEPTSETAPPSAPQGANGRPKQRTGGSSTSERMIKERIRDLRQEYPGLSGQPDEVTQQLRETFRDYGRLKANALRKKVEKVLQDMEQENGKLVLLCLSF